MHFHVASYAINLWTHTTYHANILFSTKTIYLFIYLIIQSSNF